MSKNEKHFISIDAGTTNLKINVFSPQYHFLDKYHYSYKKVVMDDVRFELDFKEIWNGIRNGINALIKRNDISKAEIFLTTSMHSVQLLDENFQLNGPLLVWSDKRGSDIVKQSSIKELERRYLITGTPNHSMNPFYKLKFMKSKLRNKFIGSLKDLIFYHLTGKWSIDTASAASSGLYDLSNQFWSKELIDELNIYVWQLPEIHKPDYCLEIRKNLFPSLKECKVYIGTTDGVSSNYLFSSIDKIAVLSIGTSHAVRIITDNPYLHFKTQNFCYEITDGKYLVGYPSNNGGNVISWIIDTFQISWKTLNAILNKRPSANGVFIPFINGERAPVWNDNISGKIINLDRSVKRESLIYTMISGVIFNIKHNVDNLYQFSNFKKIGLVGGITRSKEMCQFIADVLNYEVIVPQTPQAETLGSIALVKGIKGESNFISYSPKQSLVKEYENYVQAFHQYIN